MLASISSKMRFLSLIIPAYKQEKTIQRDIQTIRDSLRRLKISFEIIVVVDGKLDKTYENAKKMHSSQIKIVGYQHNHGKGYAVRFGMAHSKGDIVAFLDAGMDIDPNGIEKLLSLFIEKNADIVIGSKLHPESKVTYPWQRRVLSTGYRLLVKSFFGLSVKDTQVGIKLFRRKVLVDVLPRILVKRYAFDIEMLAVSYSLGYRKIYEAPIELTFNKWSSITSKNFWNTIYLMVWDTVAVYYRLKILHYYDNSSKRKWKYDPELNFKVNVG